MIQIDMQMPEACDVCPFNYDFCWCTAFGDDDNWEKYSDDWNENVCERTTRPEYCPLKEIVRCKDCKYSLSNSRFCAYPHKKNNIQPCDWFCADGEKQCESD